MSKSIGRANGTGSVYKLSGKRSRPWRAIVTVGWDASTGKQLRETVGYYATRDEATAALIAYNSNPYDLSGGKATFEQVYEQWSDQKFKVVGVSAQTSYRNSFNKCSFLWKKPFRTIGIDDLQYTIDSCGANFPTLKNIKILFGQLYKYSIPRNLCDRDYSQFVDLTAHKDKNPNALHRTAFTPEQISLFWSISDTDMGKVALMLIYSGLRIMELLNLKKEDCHIKERYIDIIEAKTKNGIRSVPLADKTVGFWKHFYEADNNSEYLIFMDERDFHGTARDKGYHSFKDSYWKKTLEIIGLSGRYLHETRHTTATLLAAAEISQPKINKILGHTGKTTAERVYTHLEIAELIEAINLI